MPNFDKTGPAGKGSMTGQGQGSCSGNQPSALPPLYGQGMGRGRGVGCCGRGFGRGVFQNPSISLEEQEKMLENRLEAIRTFKKNSNTNK